MEAISLPVRTQNHRSHVTETNHGVLLTYFAT